MGWPFSEYELIGGPWDGKTFTVFEEPPGELVATLSPEGEFQRVGRYQFKNDCYVWTGEFIVRDVSYVRD